MLQRLNVWQFVTAVCWSVMVPFLGISHAEPPPGPEYVCVRNFAASAEQHSSQDVKAGDFVRVRPADRGQSLIYTKKYAPSFCSTAPQEFKWVETMSGDKICTCDFHQEGVAEYCYSNPKIFAWALRAEN